MNPQQVEGRLTRGQLFFPRRLVICGVLLSALACSAKGPPSIPPAPEQLRPFTLEGVYFFKPGAELYRSGLRGEVVLKTSRKRPEAGYFKMRIVGRKRSGAIRMRSDRGRAYMRTDGRLELFAKHCFEYGKRDWEDRLAPLRSWTCDHLVYQFTTDELAGQGVLRGIKEPRNERLEGGKFLGRFDLVRLPRRIPAVFSGQVLGQTLTGQTVVWGFEAGKKVRDGTPLRLLDGYGRQIGGLTVKSRPGDFLLCDPVGGAVEAGRVAYTTQKIRRPGFFD